MTPPSHLRRAIVLCVSTGLMLPLASCDLLSDKPVAVAAHGWVGYEPMFLTQSRGWLDPQRVTLVPTANAQESIDALRSGKVQAAALTLDEVLSVRDQALPLSVILVFNVSMGADMLLVKPQIKALSDLKGQRIGLESSSVADILLVEILRQAGLAEADVKLVRAPVDAHLAQWQRKKADALITYEPVASRLLGLGMVNLFDSQQLPDTVIDVLAVRQDAMDTAHGNAWRHLLAAHFRAVDAIVRNPHDSAYRLARRLNLPPSGVMHAFKGIELPGVSKNVYLLGGAEPRLNSVARRLSTLAHADGKAAGSRKFSGLFRADYLPAEELLK